MPLSVQAAQGCVAAAPARCAPLRRLVRSGRRLGSPRRRSQQKAVTMKSNERRAGQGQPSLLHTVACKACGTEWKIDPAIRVICFECEAQPGEPCRWDRPHGYAATSLRCKRDISAFARR